jgi:alpha-1,3-glucan synthase
LTDTLDYIQGIGIKVSWFLLLAWNNPWLCSLQGIYIAGTPFANFPWKSDSYSVGRKTPFIAYNLTWASH